MFSYADQYRDKGKRPICLEVWEEDHWARSSDLLKKRNYELGFGFTFGLLDSHFTCDTNTDETSVGFLSEKKSGSFPRLIGLSLQAAALCCKKNETFAYIYHIYMVMYGNKVHMLFLMDQSKAASPFLMNLYAEVSTLEGANQWIPRAY